MKFFLILSYLCLLSSYIQGQDPKVMNIEPPVPGTGIKVPLSEYEKDPNNRVLPYHFLTDKPLFGKAVDATENELVVNSYILNKLWDMEINLESPIGAKVILSKEGHVLYAEVNFCSKASLKPIIESILSEMPEWKSPGKYKGQLYRVNYSIWIDPQKINEYSK